MKARVLFIIIQAICIMLASCNHDQAKHDKDNKVSPKIGTTSNLKSTEQIAHEYGCITINELFEKQYTYFIEKRLPCSLYVSSFNVQDIVSVPPEPVIVFDPNIDISLYLDFDVIDKQDYYSYDVYDGEAYYNFSNLTSRFFQKWSGKPSERQSECWLVGKTKQDLQHVDCIIGIEENQAEYFAEKGFNQPFIIQVYQIKRYDGCFVIKGDLIKILNDE